MTTFKRMILALVLSAAVIAPAQAADELMMIRVHYPFPEAMNILQQSIDKQGYTISRVQRVDVGLTKSGYKTDEYRVVFFGHREEIARLPAKYPGLAAYLPLKITIFAEGNETLLLAMNPLKLGDYFKDAALRPTLKQWSEDVRGILDRVREQDTGPAK